MAAAGRGRGLSGRAGRRGRGQGSGVGGRGRGLRVQAGGGGAGLAAAAPSSGLAAASACGGVGSRITWDRLMCFQSFLTIDLLGYTSPGTELTSQSPLAKKQRQGLHVPEVIYQNSDRISP